MPSAVEGIFLLASYAVIGVQLTLPVHAIHLTFFFVISLVYNVYGHLRFELSNRPKLVLTRIKVRKMDKQFLTHGSQG